MSLPEVDAVATWSPWLALTAAAGHALRQPGVDLARTGAHGPVVHVGRAGQRGGQGLRWRLRVHTSGKGAVSGLGEAALDRALADPRWLRHQLAEVEAARPMRATGWAAAALGRADLHICWTTTTTPPEAIRLERTVLNVLRDSPDFWNRSR